MIGAVEFLKLPGSISSVEYPLLTSSDQTLTARTVKTFPSVKFTEDLQQEIRVPYFEGYSQCNCVRMNGEIYWITGFRQDTLTQSSITFLLTYNGPSSRYHKGDTMTGVWERTGNVRKCQWLQFTPWSGDLLPMQAVDLPIIRNSGGYKRYFIQITAKARINGTEYDDAAAAIADTTQDRMAIYAMFADVSTTTGTDGPFVYADENDTSHAYPSVSIVTDYIEWLGISASNVTDISISERSPFPIATNTAHGCDIALLDKSAHLIKVGSWEFYRMDMQVSTNDFITTTMVALPGTGDEQEIGTVQIRDENGSILGTMDYASRQLGAKAEVSTYSDFTGIYTRISSPDNGQGPAVIITKPEGKLPWVGSTWEEYRAYAMAYDRQSVANANTLTTVKGITGMTSGMMSSAIGGALVGGPLGAAVGILGGMTTAISSTANIAAETSYARNEQKNLEKRTQAQPGTAYAPQYGRTYIWQTINFSTRMELLMPYAYQLGSAGWIDEYISLYGYPDDNIKRALTVAEGYFKGKLLSSSDNTGPKFDRTNDIFINGFRYLVVS